MTRARLAQEVRRRFAAGLPTALPNFQQGRLQYNIPGARVYTCRIGSQTDGLPLFLWIELMFGNHGDEFYVECGWSLGADEGPHDLHIREPLFPRGLSAGAVGCQFRMARLWQPSGYVPHWEIVPRQTIEENVARIKESLEAYLHQTPIEEAMPRVAPLVEDCLQKIRDYLLPYFAEVARQLGLQYPCLSRKTHGEGTVKSTDQPVPPEKSIRGGTRKEDAERAEESTDEE